MGLLNIRTIKSNTELCLSLDEAKRQCYIDLGDTENDVFLKNCIQNAQSIIEQNPTVPFSIFTKTFEATFEGGTRLTLPKSPVRCVEKVEIQEGGTWREIKEYEVELGDNYSFVNLQNRGCRHSHCDVRQYRVRVQFTAGEEKVENVRFDIKEAVARLTSYLFDNRVSMTEKTLRTDPVYRAIINNLIRL